MATPAQKQANRINAQKSTGPKSDDGKARSSQNARTHGLTSRECFVPPGEEEEFDSFVGGLREDLRPEGTLEEALFREVVHAAWTMQRCHRAEASLGQGSGVDPMLDEQNEAKLRRIDAYFRRAERSFHKSIKELRALQTERAYRRAAHAEEPAIVKDAPLVAYRTFPGEARRWAEAAEPISAVPEWLTKENVRLIKRIWS